MEENKIMDATPRNILPKKNAEPEEAAPEVIKAVAVSAEPEKATSITDTEKKPEKTETTPKTRKRKARDNAELVEATIKSMTDKEKENLINYLKSEITGLENKCEALQNNCEAAYEKLRMIENDYGSMEAYYKERMSYIDEQASAFYKAIRLSIVGGIN